MEFVSNSVHWTGGAIRAFDFSTVSWVGDGTKFVSNSAGLDGGALYADCSTCPGLATAPGTSPTRVAMGLQSELCNLKCFGIATALSSALPMLVTRVEQSLQPSGSFLGMATTPSTFPIRRLLEVQPT